MTPFNSPNQNTEQEKGEILFLDFDAPIKEADREYVRDLISALFGNGSTLEIDEGDSDSSLKVTGNLFQISRLRDAFDGSFSPNLKRGMTEKLMRSSDPDKKDPKPSEVEPSSEITASEKKFIRMVLRNSGI